MGNLNEICQDTFNALAALQSLCSSQDASAQPAPETLHTRMIAMIDEMRHNARQANIPERDINDAAYAVVALTDEVALQMNPNIRNFWMSRPLQLHYFNENLAGEGFFRRLRALIGDRTRHELLQIYFTCLSLGFAGQYAARGRENELDRVRQQVRQALSDKLQVEAISKRRTRPRDRNRGANRFPILLTVSAIAVVFSLGFVFSLRVMLNKQSESGQKSIQRATEALRGSNA